MIYQLQCGPSIYLGYPSYRIPIGIVVPKCLSQHKLQFQRFQAVCKSIQFSTKSAILKIQYIIQSLMMSFNKYTKYCNQQTLVKCINSQQKSEQEMHILINVFKKSLNWLQQADRQMFVDAIHRLSIRNGSSIAKDEEIVFMFVIKGMFWYYQMAFHISEYKQFMKHDENHLRYQSQSIYAVLTHSDIKYLAARSQIRQKQEIRKFIKRNIFYPYYIEDQFIKEFAYLTRTVKLKSSQALKWKDQDHSHKIGLIYKGVLSIQYNWKRNIQLCQITKGMFFTNSYIQDMIQQIAALQRQKIEEPSNKDMMAYYSKLRYVSKSDDTVLLIFNLRLINEPPYNVNPDLKISIKKQYEKYVQNLRKTIGFQDAQKLHRSKLSIKQQIKRKQEKQSIQRQLSVRIKGKDIKSSPILQTYATLQRQKYHAYSTINVDTHDIPSPSRQYSKLAFTSIATTTSRMTQSNPKLVRSKTTEEIQPNVNKSIIHKRLIHNTWLEASISSKNTKNKNTKSFSTLNSLSMYHQQRQKFQKIIKEEQSKPKEPSFFIPDQFVKRKLKLKYENLISKMKRFDFTIKKNDGERIFQKMNGLQEYVDSKRIVKMNMMKSKHMLLRDRVAY